MRNLVLIGYRGTGKSSVASRVGRALGLAVVSLDAEMVRRQKKTIPEIVAQHGWPAFRDLEQGLVAEFSAGTGRVIDCGGGVVERAENLNPLRGAGLVVWLKARPETVVGRIKGDTQRPSLTGAKSFVDEVVEVLARRDPLYRQLAHVEITTDDCSVDEVSQAVVVEARAWADRV